ncbi:ABC transporter permease [Paenibacillus agaridevorans]|uniref:ABC transporter permease n=1 Tax=Paenibacillus agaridevorans TaxID=171404 RepID=UPI001BE429A4|nr:ABC transporter permease subunit [Paenibacillus agaridevorans]
MKTFKLLAYFNRHKLLYLMLLPGLAYFIIFKYIPMGGLLLAFKDYRILDGIMGSPWAGLKWFEKIMNSPYFFNLLENTLLISIYKIIFGMPPDIILALLLNEVRKIWFKRTFQTITYLPYFLSWVIVYGIFMGLLMPNTGLINQAITSLGFEQISFLTSNEWFRTILVGTEIWKDIGFGTIIYIAALASIDPTLYEAAKMDGAGRVRQMWHISLPGITGVIVLLLIIRLGNIMEAGFSQIFTFLNAAVYSVGDVFGTWVYRTGIEEFQISIATAMGLFNGIVGLVLVVLANWLAKKITGSGIW